MGCSSQPGGDAKADVNEKSTGHSNSADEIVDAVPNQNKIGLGFFAVRFFPVAVVPVQQLFKQQKKSKAGDHIDVYRMSAPIFSTDSGIM